MISARDFVLSYSEWFSHIADHHGESSVVCLWSAISDEFLVHFRKLIAEEGFEGMVEHWTRTLKEEHANCDIIHEGDRFEIVMHECPSVGMLRSARHMTKYPQYCYHCETLYGRILKDYGFVLEVEYTDEDKGVCKLKVSKA